MAPSEPASIPTLRNKSNVGTPNRYEVFPAMMLKIKSKEPIKRMFSEVKFIENNFWAKVVIKIKKTIIIR